MRHGCTFCAPLRFDTLSSAIFSVRRKEPVNIGDLSVSVELCKIRAKSLFENYPGMLFSNKRPDGEARRRRRLCAPAHIPFRETESQGLGSPISLVGLRLRSNEARRPFAENPPGGGSFARGRRWLGRYRPLRGCSDLAALATAKIPRHSIPGSFQTDSKMQVCSRRRGR
jgi:hypothetical protein